MSNASAATEHAHVSTNALTGNRPTLMVADGLDQPLTMSSREIAQRTGKRHHHVCRDIRNMLQAIGLTETKFGSSYRDASGKSNIEYRLPKDLTLTLISGYSAPLRHAIVTRWQELEAEAASQVPQSLPEALRLAADLAEKNAALVEETQRMLPVAHTSPPGKRSFRP